MVAYVEAIGGTVRPGVRLKVDLGQTIDVGHSADEALGVDPALRARHFRCRLDTDGLLVEQLGEAISWVNGTRLGRALCKTGDWIQAGTTMFRVMLYAPYSAEALESPLEMLICSLVGEAEYLYAMFDIADCGNIDDFLPQWRENALLLTESPQVYLCSMRTMAEGIRPLVQSGLGERYGIWIRHEGQNLTTHTMRYLNSKRWIPFYQPSVLLAFRKGLQQCTWARFLGPIAWIGIRVEGQIVKIGRNPHAP